MTRINGPLSIHIINFKMKIMSANLFTSVTRKLVKEQKWGKSGAHWHSNMNDYPDLSSFLFSFLCFWCLCLKDFLWWRWSLERCLLLPDIGLSERSFERLFFDLLIFEPTLERLPSELECVVLSKFCSSSVMNKIYIYS